MERVVSLGGEPQEWLREVERRAGAAAVGGPGGVPDLAGALALATEIGDRLGAATPDRLLARWEVLATLGAVDLTVARAVEPHLDAVAILHEAGEERLLDGAGSWGVYAAEGPTRLHARSGDGGRWCLDGEKPWCSLAAHVDHALVSAWAGEERRLLAVDLRDPGVSALDGPPWVARGLPLVTSTGLRFDGVAAVAVGGEGWYLHRPGFWIGGIGVAAVWFGAVVALARRLREAASRREPDQVALVHLGAVDTALVACVAVLRHAAEQAEGSAEHEVLDGALLALRVRQVVADAVELVVGVVGRATGPGPLAAEEEHARRVADLQLYVRQHHGERDLARQGERVLAGASW